jgi:hypothetical protein
MGWNRHKGKAVTFAKLFDDIGLPFILVFMRV